MSKKRLSETYNPCDECNYAFHRQNQESGMCKICEFKSYRNLEEQRLLLRLPCKVGDTVYAIFISGFNVEKHLPIYEIFRVKVIRFLQDSFVLCFEVITENDQKSEYTVSAFGETVFLMLSEAEEKLRELEGK